MHQMPHFWAIAQTRIWTTVQRISVEPRRERLMKRDKYIGMDLHQATTVVVVLDAEGKLVLDTIVATEAAAIIRLLQGLSGPTACDIRRDDTSGVASRCDPAFGDRGRGLRSAAEQTSRGRLERDKPDARKLAELLRAGLLRSVYHGHEATRKLKELVRGYETLSVDTMRTMVRIKAIYRGRGIRTPGSGVYQLKQREQWGRAADRTGAETARGVVV
jgi:hypothetical protein